jgi:hypothetical protein
MQMFNVHTTADFDLAVTTIAGRVTRNAPVLAPMIDMLVPMLRPLVGDAVIRFRQGANGMPGNQLLLTLADGRRLNLWAVLTDYGTPGSEDEDEQVTGGTPPSIALRVSFRSNARPDLSFPAEQYLLVVDLFRAFLQPLPARVGRGDCGESDYVGEAGRVDLQPASDEVH